MTALTDWLTAVTTWGKSIDDRLAALEAARPVPAPSPAPAPTAVPAPATDDFTDLSKWVRTFTSDFSKGPLDPKIWRNTFYFNDRVLNSNGEREYYMNQGYTGDGKYLAPDGTNNLGIDPFSFLPGGVLRITADKSDPAKSAHYWGYPYTSGLITTEDSFSQTYGRFVAKMKLPAGKGLWPAFWLLPVDKSWPPELDPLEFFGAPNAAGEGGNTKIHVGMISPVPAESRGGWIDVGVDVTAGFHVYAIEVGATDTAWFFDGKQIMTGPTPAAMSKPMYVLANLAVGGTWPGLPDATTVFPAFLDVSFIRAYQRKP
jgi:beta-glucanase (GH16 family)